MSKRSDAIVKGPSRAAARAMLRATGMDDANFEGPMIAVFNTWTNMGPCNMDLDKLAVPVRAGILGPQTLWPGHVRRPGKGPALELRGSRGRTRVRPRVLDDGAAYGYPAFADFAPASDR